MTRETSIYLDLWRFGAAMVVLLGHLSGARFTGGLLWQVGPFMGQAVAVFFVLSGFIIAHVTATREADALSYATARLARVCSVAYPALLLTFVLDAAGHAIQPGLYSASWGWTPDSQPWQYLSGLLFLNQVWFTNVPQGSDLPYWSLGYEAWSYLLFGLAAFAPPRWRLAAVALALAAAGPRIAALFPLWLIGAAGHRICAARQVSPRTGAALLLASFAVWAAYNVQVWHGDELEPVILGDGSSPDLLENYIAGTLFMLHLIGFQAISPALGPILARLARPIRWAAGATFSIYLLHLPVAQFLATLAPAPPSALGTRVLILGGTLAVTFAVAEVTERRKEPWRRAVTRLLRRRAPLPALARPTLSRG